MSGYASKRNLMVAKRGTNVLLVTLVGKLVYTYRRVCGRLSEFIFLWIDHEVHDV